MWEECSPKCSSRKHADKIVSAIINGFDFEENVIKLLPTCYNVAVNKDSLGRTPLQVAATFGRMKILDWLLSHDAHVNAKDEESGYSALHRAFYFGQLQAARTLLQNNANLFQPLDNDSMSPFDHLTRDRYDFKTLDPNLPCEVYVWGTNSNYSLGIEKQSSLEFPELLDTFPKESGSIKQVAMSKFHSVFVTSAGQAFSCGIGQGGKLGLGSEGTVIGPQKICIEAENCLNSKMKRSTAIVHAALGTYHTLLLTEAGNVLSFGMNQYHQLGHTPPPTQLVTPKFLKTFEDKIKGAVIVGVCASRFHSVFWCSNSIYTCGLNAGALGHIKGERTVVLPKRVPSLSTETEFITHVAASDGATAIATDEGNVYVLHEYQCRKIASKQLGLTKVIMSGGKLDFVEEDSVIDTTPFQVLILSKSGKLNIWSQANPVLTRCSFRTGNPFAVQDIALCKNSMILISREGEAFLGTLAQTAGKKTKMETPISPMQIISRSEYPKRDHFIQIHVKRVPGIYRASTVVCDPVGKNFAVTHVHPSASMGDVAKISIPASQFKLDLKQLLDNADPDDLTHDIVFHVGTREFAAHRFIIAVNCYTFYRDVCMSSSSFKNDNKTVYITEVPAGIFQIFLEFIYTGTCALFETELSTWNLIISAEVLEKGNLSGNSDMIDTTPSKEGKRRRTSSEGCWKSERDETLRIRLVQAYAKKLGIHKLAEILEKAHVKNNVLLRNDRFSSQPKSWNRFSGEDFYDTKIQSEDGKELNVHRAMLIARSDYFRSMFGCAWIESMALKTVPLPIHSLVLEVILDFIYEDKAVKIEMSEDVDWIGNCLVVADLFLIPRLVSVCESSLVGLLTIKNVGKILEFAALYNATNLKTSCMYFICYNLSAIVELRIWNCLSEEVMNELTQFYQQFNQRKIACRLPIPIVSKEMKESLLNIDEISECLADVSLSSFNRKKGVERKKPRRKAVKKGADVKEQAQTTSTPLSVTSMAITNNDTSFKEEVWSKVNKPKKRNKSLSLDNPTKECDLASSPANVQNHEDNKVLIEESGASGLLAQNITPAKQNNLTLFEMATVVQATISPENPKCKRFPKLSQKQRKMKDITQISSTDAVPVPSPWKSFNTSLETSESTSTLSKSANDSASSSPKFHSVWKSPDKSTKNVNIPVNDVEEKFVPLQEIIIKERLQRQTLNKISTKPLKLTLIEDKAIDDLRKFYGADIVDDEYIVVERVLPLEAGVPVWSKKTVHKSKTKSRSLSMSDSGI